ncbi:hypothetical protein ACFL12_06695 [Pseudomonadota bacterium]
MIGRLNEEIHAVNEASGSKSDLLRLQREGRSMAENLPKIEKFLFDTETNKGRLANFYDKLNTMVGMFSDDDNISATDVTNFNTVRQEAVDELNKMHQLTYTGYTDGNIMQRLKNELAGLEALAPVEGIVDASGAPATNVNREVLTSLETLQNKTATAQDVTLNSIAAVFDMRKHMLSDMSTIQAAVTEINTSEQFTKLAEVEALKEKYANLLHSISLSYEVSSGIADGLASQLSKPIPAKGSVLNMFT